MMRKLTGLLSFSALALTSTSALAAIPVGFTVTVEDAGVQNTTATFDYDYLAVETFEGEDRPTGYPRNFVSTFNAPADAENPVTGTYSNVNIKDYNQYGGAGGEGQYAVAGLGVGESYSISFSSGINYFGYWLSALDAGNHLEFFSNGTSLGVFNPTDVLAFVGPDGSHYNGGAYYGNPNGVFNNDPNDDEPYVFVNFYLEDPAQTFDQIVFYQAEGSTAGYESDNHTIGLWKEQGGTEVPAVPEPATWAMLIAGFGMIGGAMRAQSRKVTFA